MAGRDDRAGRDERRPDPELALDGTLCPVCGAFVTDVPFSVTRVVGEYRESFRVCSKPCRRAALRSPNFQTNLFDGDVQTWDGLQQGDLFPPHDADEGQGQVPD
jgi:hypothetical protein